MKQRDERFSASKPTQTLDGLNIDTRARFAFIMANDREASIKHFKKAANRLQSKPRELARILQLPGVVQPQGRASLGPSNSGRQEQFVASDGTDWSSVLSSWLEAKDAAKSVRHFRNASIFRLTNPHNRAKQ